MIDKNPFQIDDFKGLNRGDESPQFGLPYQDSIPFSNFSDCKNIIFTRDGGVQTRPPFKFKSQLYTDLTAPGDFNTARQHFKIARLGTTYYDNRWLYLTYDSGSNKGRLYDSANIVGATNPTLKAITGMKWISVINIYGRLYITPLAEPGEPLTGADGVIWLYDGTTFRKAGGTGPTAGTLTITDTAVGGANVTPGLHIGAIAFETSSGFITPPGPATRIQVTIIAGGGRAARFANVDTGPAGTVARHLLLTKTIPTYDGIQDNWELFFAYRIPDNTTTTADVVLPDTGLVESADYLLSTPATLPACANISLYGTHLMYNGINTDRRIIYVSKGNDPETVDTTEDYIQVFDGIPIDILNGKELRGVYYFFKENCAFQVREDGNPPNQWRVDLVDSGLGVIPFGVAEVMANPGGLVLDNLLVASTSGLYIFSGSFSHFPISFPIQGMWTSLTKNQLKYLRMAIDPTRKRIYILVGYDGASGVNVIWVADYVRGLDFQNIRWTKWDPSPPEAIDSTGTSGAGGGGGRTIVGATLNKLAIVGSIYWSQDTTLGGYPGFWGSPFDATIFKADSERTLQYIVYNLTGKLSGAKILILTSSTPSVRSVYGTEFQTSLRTMGHIVSVTGSDTDFGSYDPLNFELVCWDSGWTGGTYHGKSTGDDVADYLLSQNIPILSGSSKGWSRYGVDTNGLHLQHSTLEVPTGNPVHIDTVDGPNSWRYQRPFLCPDFGTILSGGSWATTYFVLTTYSTHAIKLGVNTKGGTLSMHNCIAPGHGPHNDLDQGVIALWRP